MASLPPKDSHKRPPKSSQRGLKKRPQKIFQTGSPQKDPQKGVLPEKPLQALVEAPEVLRDPAPGKVCVGAVMGPHGVRGEVTLKIFTETPNSLKRFKTLEDTSGGRLFQLLSVRGAKGCRVIARFEGIDSRDAAAALKGERLYVDRSVLPLLKDPDSYYHVDLVGCAVMTTEGVFFGTVSALYNFGAGDVLGIRCEPTGQEKMISFTKEAVPEVDLDHHQIVIRKHLAIH